MSVGDLAGEQVRTNLEMGLKMSHQYTTDGNSLQSLSMPETIIDHLTGLCRFSKSAIVSISPTLTSAIDPLFQSIRYSPRNHVKLRNGNINPRYTFPSLLHAGRTPASRPQNPGPFLRQRPCCFHCPNRHAHPVISRTRP